MNLSLPSLGSCALGFVLATCFASCKQQPALPAYGMVPDFSLTRQDGSKFTNHHLNNKVTLVSFVFTRCDTICPVVTSSMAQAQLASQDQKQTIQLLSITVDPVYDTPPVLTTFANKFGADRTRWSFVTGQAAAITHLATKGFQVAADVAFSAQTETTPNIVHSEKIILVDQKLQIRGFYSSSQPSGLQTLIRDAQRLVTTKGG